ncbi:cyclase family protein [Lewinella sp. IMCC34191]|uniref:cyclase family protein n=1 Tax=Lewinella sp. IMCC34191 TaxID=2259172 RepID=UPI000E21C754|nr:cyclase family protein [Lewinella sp. IMCC34191]
MEKRVQFDFEIFFTNGGSLKGEDFRLDLTGDSISDAELIDFVVRDLRLSMVGRWAITGKKIIAKPHKRKALSPSPEGHRLVDLSHTITEGLVTYKGLPPPLVCDYLSREESKAIYAEGTTFQIGKIEMVTNTGTYVDFPYHRYADGEDSADVDLDRLADLEAIVIRVPHQVSKAITEHHLTGYEIRHRAVLIHTGWDAFWNSPQYYEDNPYLTRAAAEYLRDCSVSLVGIDSHNIDNTADGARPVHTVLLGAGIPICEHLCGLDRLPESGFTFTAAPPKFRGVGTFPVRAFARLR